MCTWGLGGFSSSSSRAVLCKKKNALYYSMMGTLCWYFFVTYLCTPSASQEVSIDMDLHRGSEGHNFTLCVQKTPKGWTPAHGQSTTEEKGRG